jgi:[protein-PII] uridylyltransferase
MSKSHHGTGAVSQGRPADETPPVSRESHTAAEDFSRARRALHESSFGPDRTSADFFHDLSRLTDVYFRRRVEEVRRDLGPEGFEFALVAVGGYGRMELCPYSDIDILLLYPDQTHPGAEEICRLLFHPLWDMGLDLGHGVRTAAQCLQLAGDDYQVFASLIDARHVAGDRDVFNDFRSRFRMFAAKHKTGFMRRLDELNTTRAERFSHVGARLEPELKNGIGGLRDYNQLLWLAKLHYGAPALDGEYPFAVFTTYDLDCLRGHISIILRARGALHYIAGRKADVLHFDLQPKVTAMLGYSDELFGNGVEYFLSNLNKALAFVRSMRQALWLDYRAKDSDEPSRTVSENIESGPRGVGFIMPGNALESPGQILDIFAHIARSGAPLSWESRRFIEKYQARVAVSLPLERATLEKLVDIFCAPHGLTASGHMLETGFLAALVPEFALVQDMVQFDSFHIHPVGWHTIETVNRLLKLAEYPVPPYSRVFAKVADIRRLVLAAFFHDIGKGEADHEATGALIASQVLERFGLDPETVADVKFLVANHLLLVLSAQRVNLSDDVAVTSLASRVGSLDRLYMLLLLTVADTQATGPKAWNEWTEALLKELFHKLENTLSRGVLAQPHAPHKLLTTRDRIRSLGAEAGAHLDQETIEASLAVMPAAYTLSNSAGDVLRHLLLVSRMRDLQAEEERRVTGGRGAAGVCALEARELPDMGCFELTFAAPDQPRLFATLCGVLDIHGLSILSADIFTWSDHTALDIFHVAPPADREYLDELWTRVRTSVKSAARGRLDLAGRLADMRSSPLARLGSVPGFEPSVKIDNAENDFYTVIDASALERPGLLYDLASALANMHVTIRSAKVVSRDQRLTTVFYVRDSLGQKILDPGRMGEVHTALVHAVHPD